MSSFLLNLSTSDITGIPIEYVLPRWTDKCFIQFIVFADIELSFTSNHNVMHVTLIHFIKSFNK